MDKLINRLKIIIIFENFYPSPILVISEEINDQLKFAFDNDINFEEVFDNCGIESLNNFKKSQRLTDVSLFEDGVRKKIESHIHKLAFIKLLNKFSFEYDINCDDVTVKNFEIRCEMCRNFISIEQTNISFNSKFLCERCYSRYEHFSKLSEKIDYLEEKINNIEEKINNLK